MKVKLKDKPVRISGTQCVNGKFAGIDSKTWKSINNGKDVEVTSITKEAEEYLVSTVETTNKNTQNKGRSLKGSK